MGECFGTTPLHLSLLTRDCRVRLRLLPAPPIQSALLAPKTPVGSIPRLQAAAARQRGPPASGGSMPHGNEPCPMPAAGAPRYPFLLVDRVVEWEKEKYAVGYKCVTINDNFFTGHFPDRPIMPGAWTPGGGRLACDTSWTPDPFLTQQTVAGSA